MAIIMEQWDYHTALGVQAGRAHRELVIVV